MSAYAEGTDPYEPDDAFGMAARELDAILDRAGRTGC